MGYGCSWAYSPALESAIRVRVFTAIVLSVFLLNSAASFASPTKVRSIPPPDPVSSLTADAPRVVNFYGAQAVAEYLSGLQAAQDEEQARQDALRASQRVSVPVVQAPQTGWEAFAACVITHESGGRPDAANPGSSASGLFQDLDSTWGGYGGYSRAMYAPVDVQYARNYELWNGGAGASNWNGTHCGYGT